MKPKDPSTIRSRRIGHSNAAARSSMTSFSAPSTGTATTMESSEFRSLDAFLETSYQQTKRVNNDSILCQWKYWAVVLSLGVANSSDAAEILCLSYILSDDTFRTSMLQDHEGGFLAAAVFLGMLVGGLFVGTLGDLFGRRPMLLVGLCGNALAGGLSALAPTVGSLTVLRCISGIGIGATVPPLFTLVAELGPPTQRGLCVTLCASFWMVGSIYVALLALLCFEYLGWSWRFLALACAVPSGMGAFLVAWWVPESPRFLGLEGRHAEAVTVANQLARKMEYRGPLWTVPEAKASFPTTTATASSSNGMLHHSSPGDRYYQSQTILGFFRMATTEFWNGAQQLYTPQLYNTTWPLQMVWFTLSFGSYGLATWITTIFEKVHLKNVYVIALLFAASNLPGNIMAAIFMDRVGRSKMLVASILAASLSLVCFAFFAFSERSTGIVVSACLFQACTITAWNTIDTLTSELFPTKVRSTGMGVCAASGRIGAMAAQFINSSLIENPVRLLSVAAVTLVLGAITPCLLPEADLTGQAVRDDIFAVTPRPQASSTMNGQKHEWNDTSSNNNTRQRNKEDEEEALFHPLNQDAVYQASTLERNITIV